ncbi:hypothetical protein [Rurimicrobium arvi]|uniref:Porin n=1 Tax=Rurimicrobium arvi TaxID=2049916 RepID=A0ABP8MP80_9BACT
MKNTFLLICLLAGTFSLSAQNFKDGKLFLNEDGSRYLKITLNNQIWMRYNQNNPGSTVNGEPRNNTADVGIRRSRMQLFGPVAYRSFFYVQIGINNFNALSDRKAGFFLHDAVVDYEFIPRALSIGGGLGGWSGVSRFASSSTSSVMGLDLPLYQEATNDVTDQFLRKLEVYAKGKIGHLDYRIIVAEPMAIQKSANYIANPAAFNTLTTVSNFNTAAPQAQVQGYFQYQFFDEESNQTPYTTGTYLGAKKVFNIGAGFLNQEKAMRRLADNGTDTVVSALRLLAVDVFYDAPLNQTKGTALSAYASVSSYDYGKNYVRNAAPMNPANGSQLPGVLNGGGNGVPLFGTGTNFYFQGGYKFRNKLLGKMGTLLPYVSVQYSKLEKLADPVAYYDCGVNWLISGHNSKISLALQSRPVFEANGAGEYVKTVRKNDIVLQYQVGF